MAWYDCHRVRFQGRLISVTTRYSEFHSAVVLKGKPLDLEWGSRDCKKLEKFYYRRCARLMQQCCEVMD